MTDIWPVIAVFAAFLGGYSFGWTRGNAGLPLGRSRFKVRRVEPTPEELAAVEEEADQRAFERQKQRVEEKVNENFGDRSVSERAAIAAEILQQGRELFPGRH